MSLCGIRGSRVVRVLVIIVLIFIVTICGQYNQNSCGKRLVDTAFLVHRGVASEPGHWPWHAAIFLTIRYQTEYACGGSVIDSSTILTAAHCLFVKRRSVQTNEISVHVGRVDLHEPTDDLQVLAVSTIFAHPQFDISHGVAHDIGIIKLSTEIALTRYVQPVCLWGTDDDLGTLVGKTGTVVGFGLNEHDQLPGILQEATLTVVDVYTCLDSNRETYGRLLTREMYCAGGRLGVSACNGDSGSGMFFEKEGTWFVRGIVSFIAKKPNTALCDSSKYTVFTDVTKYLGWVQSIDTPSSFRNQEIVIQPDIPRGFNEVTTVRGLEHGFLLVGGYDKISHVPLNGSQSFSISTTYGANGLAHDCVEGRFYWSDYETKQIHSAKYDGTDQKAFITEDIMDPHGVAVDWISRRLYWTDWEKNTVEVASLENPNVRTVLIYETLLPGPIAVDPQQGKLFWTNENANGQEEFEWSNLDGSERQVLDNIPRLDGVTSIKVFKATGELCYTDKGRRKVECIDPYSKRIRKLASDLSEPWTLAVTDELLYWTDLTENKIEVIDLQGVRRMPITSPAIDFSYASGMTAVTDKCPESYSPCAMHNDDCPVNTICLVNLGAPDGRSCLARKECKLEKCLAAKTCKCAAASFDNTEIEESKFS